MEEKVCIVTGVGEGTGRAVVERFAAGDYRVAMLTRNEARGSRYEEEIPGAVVYPCDVQQETEVKSTVAAVADELGPPTVLVHNAVSFDSIFGTFLEIEPSSLWDNFQVNTMGLFHMARAVTPYMLPAARGAIMVTGNTAARRGRQQFAAFAPTKAAQRILTESIARTLGPKGIHVSYILIDGGIDMPFARTVLPGRPDEFFIKTSAIASTIWDVVHQDRSGWTFELDIRPFAEKW